MSVASPFDSGLAQDPGDRKEQQDRAALIVHPAAGDVLLAVVADGMGGRLGGAQAAEQVVAVAASAFAAFRPGQDDAAGLLRISLSDAHRTIRELHRERERDPHSTGVLLVLQPGRADWGHCGDSRLYRFRDGRLLARTVDHSYVEYLIASGRISSEQAASHPNRNILMSALGSKEAPRLEFGESRDLQPGDVFLLCSDGVWGYFSDDELAALVGQRSAADACAAIIDAARQRSDGEGDNLSIALVRVMR